MAHRIQAFAALVRTTRWSHRRGARQHVTPFRPDTQPRGLPPPSTATCSTLSRSSSESDQWPAQKSDDVPSNAATATGTARCRQDSRARPGIEATGSHNNPRTPGRRSFPAAPG
jgi:hypothetical protein